MSKINRREFLYDSLLATAAAAVAPSLARAQEAKPGTASDTIRFGVVGVNGRGMNHVNDLIGMKDAVVAAICDVDSTVGERVCSTVEGKTGKRPEFHRDIRKMLESKEIDAISIATPNHWHALGAIWGVQAGKDVYVEKPVSHNVWEGRKIVEAARKYGKIVQTGTQSRSMEGMRQAIQFLHDGKIGKLKIARGLCYKPRGSIGKVDGPQQPPASVDYDLWSGPAPLKPIMRKQFHYDWHWQWDYGNGDIGNQGIHQVDIARWGMGKTTLAKSVVSVGGRFSYVDDGETPNTLITFLDYDDSQLIFEVRGLPEKKGAKNMDKYQGASIGVVFHCENGYLVCPSYSAGVAYDLEGKQIAKFDKGGDHFRNFLGAVRSRKHTDLHADIEEGHLSSALCHLANISYRLGALKPFDAKEAPFGKNEAAYETFDRVRSHLRANELKLEEVQCRMGKYLNIHAAHEHFDDNEKEANAMLTRDYRKPYIVPEKV